MRSRKERKDLAVVGSNVIIKTGTTIVGVLAGGDLGRSKTKDPNPDDGDWFELIHSFIDSIE
ncbi:hypothetical protein [Neobacillus cucumis]|nr:hypothetical protein [Neobacillus cucumis]